MNAEGYTELPVYKRWRRFGRCLSNKRFNRRINRVNKLQLNLSHLKEITIKSPFQGVKKEVFRFYEGKMIQNEVMTTIGIIYLLTSILNGVVNVFHI